MVDKIDAPTAVNAEMQFNVLPKYLVGRLKKDDTTPSVKNVECVSASGTVVTITNFKDGKSGQHLYILGDGTSTVEHGTRIKTKDLTDRLLDVDIVYHFVNINGFWYEVA